MKADFENTRVRFNIVDVCSRSIRHGLDPFHHVFIMSNYRVDDTVRVVLIVAF